MNIAYKDSESFLATMDHGRLWKVIVDVYHDGITAIVDPQGRIQASIPRYVTTVLTGKIQFMQGSTPWMHLGIYPIMLFMLLGLLFALVGQRRTAYPSY